MTPFRRPAALSLSLLLVATAVLAQTPAGSDPAAGYAIAEARCAACHAITGVEERPSSGAPPFPDIGRRFPGPALDARLTVVLRQGHYAMPARPTTEAERAAIAAYIREAAARTGPETP